MIGTFSMIVLLLKWLVTGPYHCTLSIISTLEYFSIHDWFLLLGIVGDYHSQLSLALLVIVGHQILWILILIGDCGWFLFWGTLVDDLNQITSLLVNIVFCNPLLAIHYAYIYIYIYGSSMIDAIWCIMVYPLLVVYDYFSETSLESILTMKYERQQRTWNFASENLWSARINKHWWLLWSINYPLTLPCINKPLETNHSLPMGHSDSPPGSRGAQQILELVAKSAQPWPFPTSRLPSPCPAVVWTSASSFEIFLFYIYYTWTALSNCSGPFHLDPKVVSECVQVTRDFWLLLRTHCFQVYSFWVSYLRVM